MGDTEEEARLVGGRYRLVERIGSGGMGTVWRAVDERVGREVAVKEPRLPGDPRDPAHRRSYARLQREARAAALVEHPGAVAIHDVVTEDGLPWIVMELIRGESLHEVLGRGALSPAESARIGLAVVGALAAAHAKGIVHRDVKPANVLLGPHGRVVLTDFGIAHVQGEESLTVSGEFIGSLEFIAPERMSGPGAGGPASDLWSLGVLLYAAVEGWSPFRRTTLESTLAAILSIEPPEPKQAGPLGPLIVRLLAKDPALRPGAEEVAKALQGLAQGRWPEAAVWDGPGLGEGASDGSGSGRHVPEPQDASLLLEFGDDAGTVRLAGVASVAAGGGAADGASATDRDEGTTDGASAADQDEGTADGVPVTDHDDGASLADHDEGASHASGRPGEEPPTAPVGVSTSRARSRARLIAVTLAGALLLGGAVWFGLPLGDGGAEGRGAQASPSASATRSPSASASASPAVKWISHREKKINAELSLPEDLTEFAREDSDSDHQRIAARLVVYANDAVEIRLTVEDTAPDDAMTWAHQAAATWKGYDADARTQYARTSFNGYQAALADTTYEAGDESDPYPLRCVQLVIITDDGEFYELRADMRKGTKAEREGMAVFKGARERLKVGAAMGKSD
ncbi:serine/threonine-protein kinase [Streptomyces sp. NPDC002896]|uniref:serine/threonine-protein kinase n=1 Tax=Streptomyces sp. NPDC002896 TaxID=3154438 RepID=UPI003328870A